MGDKQDGLHIGYRLVRLQHDLSFLIVEWAMIAITITLVIGDRLSGTMLVVVVFEFAPFAVVLQWIIVALRVVATPGYISFLNETLKIKSSESGGRLPLAEFDTLMRALAALGNRVTDGHGNDLVAVLKGADPMRKGNEALTFAEIGYAIKLRMISESYIRPHSERKRPFADFSEALAGSASTQERNKNGFIGNLLSVYGKLPDECRLVASISNPDSASMRLRQWQLTTYRIGLITAVVAALVSIAALL